jgi:hypothetical protein
MISLLILVVILIVAMTMLFQMRAFAERQQYFMLPRQAARRATDYLSYYIAGASDANYVITTQQSPNALITYYNKGGALTQASYNNLKGTEPGNSARNLPATALRPAIASTAFGDLGTDTITLVAPFNPSRYQVFAPFQPTSASEDLWLNFRVGCNCLPAACVAADDAANLEAFKAATGFDAAAGSTLLMLVDKTGSWAYLKIPPAGLAAGGLCSDVTLFKNIHIQADTTAAPLAPPNGAGGLLDPVYLVAGLQVISFRVLTDSVDGVPKLQQKLGLFDPVNDTADNPLSGFTNVMENVEDLQIAYMYPDGSIWNTEGVGRTISSAAPGCPLAACDNGVPFQAGPNFGGATPPLDIQNVIGVRFSVTGRSPLLPIGARQLTNITAGVPLAAIPSQTANQHFRPRSEDHDVDFDTVHTTWPLFDQFDHYRATATLMLRNRTPKG